MTEQALYDLAPAGRLMLMGLMIALGPLAWVWLRSRNSPLPHRLRVLTLVTLFLTFDLVLFGAFTRLTDSGLGCPDWPGCYGSASPIGAHTEITQAAAAMPTGPVTLPKAWIEMIHRYLATSVGVLILTLSLVTALAWRNHRRDDRLNSRRDPLLHPGWPAFTLLWVCLQGAFGALTVTMKLFPLIVTIHLLGGMGLLALLRWQASRFAVAAGELKITPVSSAARNLLLTTFALVWLQIALGGWVSTNYAVLACTDFPTCQGSFWPPMEFSSAFTLWRELGAGVGGDNLSFQALTAIHYVHRLSAYVVFAAMLWLARMFWRDPATRHHGQWLLGLALWQFGTGLSNVVLGWPLMAAVSHTGGAAALVVVLTSALMTCRRAAAPATVPTPLPPIDSSASRLSA
jgi:cytochrome c oxidase assembly protein subunit 15